MKQQTWDQLAPTLQTGDIVLFSGRYTMSKVVQVLEDSPWSHVAMVVRLPEFAEPLLWEATDLTNLADVEFNDHMTGPKVCRMKARLETYGADVEPYEPPLYAVRRLHVERTPEMLAALDAFIAKEHGIPNPSTAEMILGTMESRFLHIDTDVMQKTTTCSELIANTYEQLGLLTLQRPASGYIPKDFSSEGELSLNDGWLEEEIRIVL